MHFLLLFLLALRLLTRLPLYVVSLCLFGLRGQQLLARFAYRRLTVELPRHDHCLYLHLYLLMHQYFDELLRLFRTSLVSTLPFLGFLKSFEDTR